MAGCPAGRVHGGGSRGRPGPRDRLGRRRARGRGHGVDDGLRRGLRHRADRRRRGSTPCRTRAPGGLRGSRAPGFRERRDRRGGEGRRHVRPRPPAPRLSRDRRLRAASRDAAGGGARSRPRPERWTSATWRSSPGSRSGAGCGTGRAAGIDGATVRAACGARESAGKPRPRAGPTVAYVLGGLRPGRHQVTAALPGYATAYAMAEAGGEPVDVVMESGGEIAGRVVDAEGSPVEERPRADGGRPTTGVPDGVIRRARRRARAVRAARRGRRALRRAGPGQRTRARRAIRGAGRRGPDGPRSARSRLARRRHVQGMVVDAEGQGIPGATVTRSGTRTGSTGQLETQTGSTGAFELSGVPVGPVHVVARHPSYASRQPVVAEVDPEKETAPVRIVLARRRAHRGARGAPRRAAVRRRPRARVAARAGGREWEDGEAAPRRRPDGSFVMEHVPAGRMKLDLMAFTPSSPMASGMGGGHPDDGRLARGGGARRRDGAGRSRAARRRGGGPRDPRRPARARRSRRA